MQLKVQQTPKVKVDFPCLELVWSSIVWYCLVLSGVICLFLFELMSSHDITEPHTLWGPEAFFRCSSPRPWKTPSDLQTEEIINPRFEMNPKKSKNMKPYEIHRKINLKYGLSLSTLHQLDIFFSEYKWHIWVNLRQVNQNLVLSLQWSCWPEVWSWSLARVLTLCQPLWDGVVQCFPMTFLRPPHRYVCKLQTYVCKTRSQKRKGLIICKKMNKLEVSSIQICWLHMTSYPFPRPSYGKKNPDAQFDLLHVDGGHQLGAYPA